jgi:Fe-coproporphyrin III synthase
MRTRAPASTMVEFAQASGANWPLERLPLVTLYLSERCNSRCVTCDYWRHGAADMSFEAVQQLLPDLERLRTEVVLISGGEPLLNPHWPQIAELLRRQGLKLWLLSSGLSLAKHAKRVQGLFDSVTVSLDGTNPATYAAIRGVDAFEKVCEGIRAAAQLGTPVSVRVTLQRANYRELPLFVAAAHALGAYEVSFLAVDVANPHAFARQNPIAPDLALGAEDLPVLDQLLRDIEVQCAEDFRSRFIAQDVPKLRRIYQYFAAIRGLAPYPKVRCNAPEFSAVLSAQGKLNPCFFINGPSDDLDRQPLRQSLNSSAMLELREAIRGGSRPECARCVCSMWRDPSERVWPGMLIGVGHDG